jgi:hypothetical protein
MWAIFILFNYFYQGWSLPVRLHIKVAAKPTGWVLEQGSNQTLIGIKSRLQTSSLSDTTNELGNEYRSVVG